MNTVKRWLAGFLSFAMIFTSAAFTNVGALTVYADANNHATQDANSVVKLTIDTTVTYWDSVEDAIGEANNESGNVDAGEVKTITFDMLKDGEVVWRTFNNRGLQMNVPATINLNGFALAAPADNYRWGGGNTYDVCAAPIYTGGNLVQIKFAIHKPNYEFEWVLDGQEWTVNSYKEVCPNCGSNDDATFSTRNSTSSQGYFQWTPETRRNYSRFSDNYFKTELNEETNIWELNEYERSGNRPYTYTFVETVSTFDAKKGYVLTADPRFDMDGSMIKHNADGTPIIKVNLVKVADGSTIKNPDVTITPATSQEIVAANRIFRTEDWYTSNYSGRFAPIPRSSIENKDATCEEFGDKWYHVVVTDPDGVKQFDYLMLDYQADGILDHKAGQVLGVQVLTRSAEYDSAADAKDAADRQGIEFVKIAYEQTDWNADGDYTDLEDFSGFYYWYWNRASQMGDNLHSALSLDGTFTYRIVYRCYYNETKQQTRTIVYGDEVTAKPLADVTADTLSKAKAAKGDRIGLGPDTNIDLFSNSAYSTCTHWNYEKVSVQEEYINNRNNKVIPESKYNYTFPTQDKATVKYSHTPDTTTSGHADVTVVEPTCCEDGYKGYKCLICGNQGQHMETIPATGTGHDYIDYPGKKSDVTVQMIDPSLTDTKSDGSSAHSITWNDDGSVSITATCSEPGGVYKYCVKTANKTPGPQYGLGGKWILQSSVPAKGHTLAKVAANNTWTHASYNGTDPETTDFQNIAFVQCTECGENEIVTFHSMAGEDTLTGKGMIDLYNAINVDNPDKGKDCQTEAKITWTVKGYTDKDKKPITKEYTKQGTFGDHDLDNIKWTWAEGYETATASGKCKICKEEQTATVEAKQTTSEDGITTFTATYGSSTDTKKAFTLVDAVVTYDTSLLTDGNLIAGIEGTSQQVPDVTVTKNGTVIDPSLYEATWLYNRARKTVMVFVDWTEDVKASTAADHVEAIAWAENFQLEAKNQIKNVEFALYANGELTDDWNNEYDPAVTYTIKTKSVPSNVTVKYAILDKKVTADAGDAEALQKKIEALTFDKDKVELKEVGKYYVYAQLTKDGYTTYTTYVAPQGYGEVEPVVISEKAITVYVNNIEMTVGETPVLEKAAYDSKGRKIEIDWDAEQFKFTAAGGKEFKDLSAGTYLIWVEAPNYVVVNSGSSDNRVGTLTVKAKTDDQKVAEEVIADLIAAGTDADKLATAFEKFSKLTDAQKQLVKANNEANSQLAPAEKAYNDKKAAEEEAAKKAAEKKALDDATAAGKNAIASANAYASDATIKALIDALNAAIAKKDTAAIQKATADLNNAVASKKAAPAKKSTPSVKISTKSKTYKAKDLKKKAKSFKIKYSKTSGSGKATFKKSSGSKKLKVSKAGKITVKKGTKKGTYKIKVKLTVAANSKFNAKTVKKTIKVKVK